MLAGSVYVDVIVRTSDIVTLGGVSYRTVITVMVVGGRTSTFMLVVVLVTVIRAVVVTVLILGSSHFDAEGAWTVPERLDPGQVPNSGLHPAPQYSTVDPQ